jgi:hypothetical protein
VVVASPLDGCSPLQNSTGGGGAGMAGAVVLIQRGVGCLPSFLTTAQFQSPLEQSRSLARLETSLSGTLPAWLPA